MGDTRPTDARRAAQRGSLLSHPRWVRAASVLAIGCATLTGDGDRVIAIQLDQAPKDVEVGDTLRLTAQAVTASGEVISDAEITWALLSVDSGQVGFTLDEAGLITAIVPGTGQVQATFEEIRSDPIDVNSTPMPDSAAGTAAIVPFPSGSDKSAPMTVTIFEFVTSPGQATALANKPVLFQLVDPAPGTSAADGLFLLGSDTIPESDPHRVTAPSGADGAAIATVNVNSGSTRPDTIRVEATVTTATGGVVAGSPLQFIVAGSSEF